MNANLDRPPWDGLFPIDAVTSMTCVHQGIEYRGEVVRASRWSSRLGDAPGDGCHFKIVLLHERPKSRPSQWVHQKTAICVPAHSPGRPVHRIIEEITAAKQAAYPTRRDVDAAAINSAFRERRGWTGSWFLRRRQGSPREPSVSTMVRDPIPGKSSPARARPNGLRV